MSYQPDRRDFFGIIAAPLFRNLVPPTPIAGTSACAMTGLAVCADNGQWHSVSKIDDLDVFSDIPAKMGRMARHHEEIMIANFFKDGK